MTVYLQGALWIGLACLGSALLLLLLRRGADQGHRKDMNDVNGLIFAIVGVLYAIVVGFVVTSQWQNVGSARDAGQREANGLVRVYWAAQQLPADQRASVQTLCRQYATVVRDQEWPAMRRADPAGPRGQALLDQLARTAHASGTPAAQVGSLDDALNTVYAGRQQRLDLAGQSLSGMMWFVMVAGGLFTVALTYLFGVAGRTAHLVMVVSLVGTIGLLLYASYQLQYPFGPATDLGPDGMVSALRLFGAPAR
ncbi:MAG: hypothetical protein WCA46_30185 [Actinocatenispora sp.]